MIRETDFMKFLPNVAEFRHNDIVILNTGGINDELIAAHAHHNIRRPKIPAHHICHCLQNLISARMPVIIINILEIIDIRQNEGAGDSVRKIFLNHFVAASAVQNSRKTVMLCRIHRNIPVLQRLKMRPCQPIIKVQRYNRCEQKLNGLRPQHFLRGTHAHHQKIHCTDCHDCDRYSQRRVHNRQSHRNQHERENISRIIRMNRSLKEHIPEQQNKIPDIGCHRR